MIRGLALGGRTLVMGVINVTPDSFWADSRFPEPEEAAAAARRFVEQGADLLDVGGQSTRPRAPLLSPEEEVRRVLPALRAIRASVGCPVSIDTFWASVAQAAVAAGADIVNDVSGLWADPGMAAAVARLDVPLILMDRGRLPVSADAAEAVAANLRRALGRAAAAGIAPERVILDPGFGFGKTTAQNLALVREWPRLRALGRPLCLGVSRKGTIGRALGGLGVGERLEGTLALVALAAAAGVEIVRVHDVRESALVVRMVETTLRPQAPAPAGPAAGGAAQSGAGDGPGLVAALAAAAPAEGLARAEAGAGDGQAAGPAPLAEPPASGAGAGAGDGPGDGNSAPLPGDVLPRLARGLPPAGGSPSGPSPAGGAAADEIRLEGITVQAVHGVLPQERLAPQPFVVDVTLRLDLTEAGRADRLDATVDYAQVAAMVAEVVAAGPPRNLIESLAAAVAERLTSRLPVAEVDVRVHKPQAPVGVPFGDVSVRVRRRRG